MPTPAENFVVCDLYSATYFSFANAVLIDVTKLTEQQLHVLEQGSDSARRELAREVGVAHDVEENEAG